MKMVILKNELKFVYPEKPDNIFNELHTWPEGGHKGDHHNNNL